MKEINPHSKIENWKEGMLSDDWNTVLKSRDNLVKIGGKDVAEFLIGLLESKKPTIRNGAALALHDLKNNEAIEPILSSIFKLENKNYNGTMVYALENLDCKDKLVEIFKILFYHGYESKMGAYTILSEQFFEFNKSDLEEIQRMWKECSQNPNRGEGFDNEETKLIMKDAYEGFLEYLKEESNSAANQVDGPTSAN